MEMDSLQKPHPPLWYGAHSPDSAERAARKGLHMVTNDQPPAARAMVERYRKVWRELHGTGGEEPKMGVVRFVLVAETDAKAMAIARRAYLRWRSSFTHLFQKFGTQPDSPLRVNAFETVKTFLGKQVADSGQNYVVGQFCFGDLTLDEMLRSVELFADQVMPALRAVKSPTRAMVS
jgi:alkanesulfonate monooxygenase SsuD/methylene tetrahydromethanopterin reductase-like flavin-dependent oxidoreductase (luciferase family)